MEHSYPLITTIVAAIVAAFIFGLVAKRLKVPSIVGYMIAGILIGPHTPGVEANVEIASQLSEIGVILLMFGVGMHFSFTDLLSVRNIVIPGALIQVAVGTSLGYAISKAAGFSSAEGLSFGFILSVASTIVAMRILEAKNLIKTEIGKIAVGWLIVEDIFTVLVIVLLPIIAELLEQKKVISLQVIGTHFGITLLKISIFATIMVVAGRKFLPKLLVMIAKTKSRELMSLGTLAIALGFAYTAYTLFNASFALGAFLAGFVLNESEIGHKAAEQSLPLRDTFAVLFFVSVGMLFDPAVLIKDPLSVLMTLGVVAVGTSLTTFVVIRLFKKSLRTAALVAVSLAQIGEFSFIFAGMARQLDMLSPHMYDVVLAAALLSIGINPFLFSFVEKRFPPKSLLSF